MAALPGVGWSMGEPEQDTWSRWLTAATDSETSRQIGARVHRSHSTVARWIRTGEVPAGDVIAIARAYDADAIAGLVAAGHLRNEDVFPHIRRAVSIAPATFLADELAARVREWEEATVAGRAYEPTFIFPYQLRRPSGPDPVR
jgi:hypothetical protein